MVTDVFIFFCWGYIIAGVTLMALGAMAKYEGLDVKIVPVGLNYFHAHRFRSRAVIEFGNPITVSDELVHKFKAGGNEKREACSSLLDSIYNALKTVTINAGSYETLMVRIFIYQNCIYVTCGSCVLLVVVVS